MAAYAMLISLGKKKIQYGFAKKIRKWVCEQENYNKRYQKTL